MARPEYPITPAIRMLREAGVVFEPLLYRYVDRGGTATSSAALGWPEHQVIKTIVMLREQTEPLLVLMHGDLEVSTRALARVIGARSVEPCPVPKAERWTGYQVGGISPFGVRTAMPVYAQSTIFELDRIAINGGKRGFLVALAPQALQQVLQAVSVDAAAAK